MVSIRFHGTSKDSLKGTPIITTFALILEIFIFYRVTEDLSESADVRAILEKRTPDRRLVKQQKRFLHLHSLI